jgi:hypothetical protein
MLDEIASLPIGDEDKALMRQGVEKDIKERLDKQAWKDFQDSDMYVRLFENLEGASVSALEKMEQALLKVRENLTELSPTELKEINNQLEKIQDLKIEKNPFKGLKEDAVEYFEYLKNRKDWEKSYEDSLSKESTLKEKIDAEQLAIDADEKVLATTEKMYGEESLVVKVLANNLKVRKEQLNVLLDQLVAQKEITQAEAEKLRNSENATKNMKDRFKEYADYAYGISSALGNMADNLEKAFGMSESLRDTFNLIQGVGGGIGDLFSGAAGVMSGNPLGMIQGGMQLIGGFSKIIGGFNDAYDN